MRATPALFDRKKSMAIDGNSEFYPCVFCGPLSEYDIDVEREVICEQPTCDCNVVRCMQTFCTHTGR